MNREEFNKALEYIRKVSLDTLQAKNAAYADCSADPLHNFVVGAAMTEGTPAQAAWGYLTKHLVALHDKVMHNDFSDLDDLEEKCKDGINYLTFLYIIGVEENKKYTHAVPKGANSSDQLTMDELIEQHKETIFA